MSSVLFMNKIVIIKGQKKTFGGSEQVYGIDCGYDFMGIFFYPYSSICIY